MEFEVDLQGVVRLDIERTDGAGRVLARVESLPFDPEDRSVTTACERQLAIESVQQFPVQGSRLISVESGGDRVLATHRFHAVNVPPARVP